MMRKYGKIIGMSAAALGLTAVLTVESSMAYFTTYVSAGGDQVVNLQAQTELHEDVTEMTKHIGITNTSPENDCYVRVKVFYVDYDYIKIILIKFFLALWHMNLCIQNRSRLARLKFRPIIPVSAQNRIVGIVIVPVAFMSLFCFIFNINLVVVYIEHLFLFCTACLYQ